jgi:hypothetical protein
MGTRAYETDAYGGNEDGGIDGDNTPDGYFVHVVWGSSTVSVDGALDERRRLRVRHGATSELDEDRHLVDVLCKACSLNCLKYIVYRKVAVASNGRKG